jgi:hypothetical protein
MSNQKIQSALDAAGTAADYSARATYQRGYEAGCAVNSSTDMTADLSRTIDSLTLQLESAHREAERLRTACEKILSWSTIDTAILLSNPPQNAALVNAQSVLRSALVRDNSNDSR